MAARFFGLTKVCFRPNKGHFFPGNSFSYLNQESNPLLKLLQRRQIMDAKQHLYYALGALAYAVAMADGKVQHEEREKLQDIVTSGTDHEIDFTYTDIIFKLLQQDKTGFKEVYHWAMKSFELGKYHFTPAMKAEFIAIIQQVADAFPPTVPEEQALISRFADDLGKLDVKTLIN
jgi:uncharacterized tellurite resistance protein B-like protein